MKEFFLALISLFAVLLLVCGLGWLAEGNQFFLYRYFAPRYEDTRREVFEHSKAYRQGMVQELQNMQFQYARAGKTQREALASIILHRAADVDESAMPADLVIFVANLRRERQTPEREFSP